MRQRVLLAFLFRRGVTYNDSLHKCIKTHREKARKKRTFSTNAQVRLKLDSTQRLNQSNLLSHLCMIAFYGLHLCSPLSNDLKHRLAVPLLPGTRRSKSSWMNAINCSNQTSHIKDKLSVSWEDLVINLYDRPLFCFSSAVIMCKELHNHNAGCWSQASRSTLLINWAGWECAHLTQRQQHGLQAYARGSSRSVKSWL